MKEFLQRVRGSGDTVILEPRVTLGAFGKHPGWNDHILGIGVETEGLAWLKHLLYVDGIGAQIDAGAWEKLPAGKRAEGFCHTFLWFRGGLSFLGIMWSSQDGKGRAKYPMVLCLEAQGVSPGFLLDRGLPALLSLKDACVATSSAEEVTARCQQMQEDFRRQFGTMTAQWNRTLPVEERRAFLSSAELGVRHIGLLRIWHELGAAPGLLRVNRKTATAGGKQVCRVVRVPLAAASATEALWRWSEFLRTSVHESFDLGLVARAGVPWLDVVVGDPKGQDFFFLQAALEAMPRASDVPYELAPELDQWLGQAEASYFGSTMLITAPGPSSAAPPPVPTPVSSTPNAPSGAVSKGKMFAIVVGSVILFFLLAGIIAALLKPGLEEGNPKPKEAPPVTNTVEKASPPAAVAAPDSRAYDEAMLAAETARKRADFTNAIVHSESALRLRPGDAPALAIMAEARRSLGQAIAEAAQQAQVKTQQLLAAVAAAAPPPVVATPVPAPVPTPKPATPKAVVVPTALSSLTNQPLPTLASGVSSASPSAVLTAPRQALTSTRAGMDFVWVPAIKASVAKFEVTQGQYSGVMGKLPAGQLASGATLPVANVSCDEARAFCKQLSVREGKQVGLPTEAEWIALAGLSANEVTNAYKVLQERGALGGEVVGPALAAPLPVGSRTANQAGIFDLLGNVREWVEGGEACKSAGFAFNLRVGRTRMLLLKGPFSVEDAWIQAATGIRCVLREP
jgi:formylglycine-generating enzyme required for sulfatase activity